MPIILFFFRRWVLIAGNLSNNGKLTFIDSEIINGYPSAKGSEIGVRVEALEDGLYGSDNKMNLMRSSIEDFPIGLFGGNWTADTQNTIQVHKTKLSSNTIGK